MGDTDVRQGFRSSHLFLVRLWKQEAVDGNLEWCGKVQRTVTGEEGHFRDMQALVDLLLAMVPPGESARSVHPVALRDAGGE
jgi:hypothetical protein